MRRSMKIYVLAAVVLFGLNSCDTKIEDISMSEWNPKVAFPLVNTEVGMQDLVDEFSTGGFIQVNEDKLLTVVYQGTVLSVKGEDVVQIPSQITVPLMSNQTSVTYPNTNGVKLDEIRFKTGQISINLTSERSEPIDVLLRIPNLVNNGEAFEYQTTIDAMGNATFTEDIAGQLFMMMNNQFMITYTATLPNGEEVSLSESAIQFDDMSYNYVEGYLGDYEFDLPLENIVLDLFGNPDMEIGSVFFEEPSIQLNIKNTFGMPIRAKIETLNAIRGDQTIALDSEPLNDGINFSYPALSEVGQMKETAVTVNKDNSNITDFLALLPESIEYELNASSNPTGNTEIMGHITDESYFEVDVDVELPFYGRASGFSMTQSFDFNLEDYKEIETAEFKLVADNGFPLDMNIQLYFLNENGDRIDSLLTGTNKSLLEAAAIDNTGRVTSPTTNTIEEYFSAERFERIEREATQIEVHSSIATINEGSESVKIFTDYTVGIRLGMVAELLP